MSFQHGSLSRRRLLGAAGIVAGAGALPLLGGCAPQPATQAGYTRLAFGDEFDSPNTIDISGTGAPGYKWYASGWFGFSTTPADNIRVSNSILTLGGGTSAPRGPGAHLNTAIAKRDTPYHTGNVFGGGGYFEARIAFDPALGARAGRHWPCFWSMAVEHVYQGFHQADEQWPGQAPGYAHFAELDFFEAYHAPHESYVGKTSYLGAPHDWSGKWENGNWQYNIQTGNRLVQTGAVDWKQFHNYGCLWVPQQGTQPGYAQFFFDELPGPLVFWKGPIGNPPLPGQPAPGQVGTYTAATPDRASKTYAILDQQRLAVVLGTDYAWPMQVDWVRIWQKPL